MIRILYVCMLGSLLLFSCSFTPAAIGNWNSVTVFAEGDVWDRISDNIREIYERKIITPQEEYLYTVNHTPLQNFEILKKQRVIIIAATFDTRGKMGNLLREVCPPEVFDQFRAGDYLYARENLFAKDQVVLIYVAPTIDDLENELVKNSDKLFDLVDNTRNKFRKAHMFKRGENVKLAERIMKDYNFSIRVQHDYYLRVENPDAKYLWFRRFDPDRMIVIHWIDTTDVEFISEEWAHQTRDNLGKKYIDSTIVNTEFTTFSTKSFLDYYAVEARGLWRKVDHTLGGPLVNYTFFDENTSRIYMIDLMVFAPDFFAQKEPFIRQLEIIARTFRTAEPQRTN